MAVQTVENIQRLPPFFRGFAKKIVANWIWSIRW